MLLFISHGHPCGNWVLPALMWRPRHARHRLVNGEKPKSPWKIKNLSLARLWPGSPMLRPQPKLQAVGKISGLLKPPWERTPHTPGPGLEPVFTFLTSPIDSHPAPHYGDTQRAGKLLSWREATSTSNPCTEDFSSLTL